MAKGDVFNNKLGTKIQSNRPADAEEIQMLKAIEHKRILEKYKKQFEGIEKGTAEIPQLLRQLAPQMLKGLLVTVETTQSEKLKTDIQQDLLDRAGYGKVTKAVNLSGTLDADTTRRELINMVRTKAKIAGITIQGDEDEEATRPDTVDVSATSLSASKSGDSRSHTKQVRGKDQKPSQDDSDK